MKITVEVDSKEVDRIGGAVARAYGRTAPATTGEARKVIGEVLAEHLQRIVVGVETADLAAATTPATVTPPAVTVTL